MIMNKAQNQALVKEFAAEMNIQLVFLSSYLPNLNLLERFWKYVKKKCLYSRYYETFGLFKEAIKNGLYNRNDQINQERDALLTSKFQTFKNVK